jgi:N-methylhydantoinase B
MNIVETLTSVCNPITVELVSGALRSAQAEMEALLARTAMSPFIREKKDFFVALYDPQGRMVAGTSVPLLGDVIQPILNQYPADEMAEGDLYWFNDCYGSGGAVSHTPDQVYVAPVFVERKLSAYAQTWAHFNDIGGLRPGSLSSDATDIFQEGVIIPPVRLYRRGEINDELQRTFECNSRFPNVVRGDTRACGVGSAWGTASD